jgi:hypothetical protein
VTFCVVARPFVVRHTPWRGRDGCGMDGARNRLGAIGQQEHTRRVYMVHGHFFKR